MQTDSTQAAHELGDASFYLHDYHFRQDNHNGICTLQPQNRQGYGNIYQVQPTAGYHTPQWNANMRSIKSW